MSDIVRYNSNQFLAMLPPHLRTAKAVEYCDQLAANPDPNQLNWFAAYCQQEQAKVNQVVDAEIVNEPTPVYQHPPQYQQPQQWGQIAPYYQQPIQPQIVYQPQPYPVHIPYPVEVPVPVPTPSPQVQVIRHETRYESTVEFDLAKFLMSLAIVWILLAFVAIAFGYDNRQTNIYMNQPTQQQ